MDLSTPPKFFKTSLDFRKWLEKNHESASDLIVGFHKVGSGKPCMSWSEAVDQALCFGWIDGIRKSIDANSYFIRFTPRKASSIWSAVNIKKIDELTRQNLMRPAGIASFKLRKEHLSKIYSFEKEAVKLSAAFEQQFKANKTAWKFFQTLPPSYHKPALNWVMSAKQQATSVKRLNELIEASEKGKKIKMLDY